MAEGEGTYEDECDRAELLGIDPPNKADFDAALKVRQEEIEKEISNVSWKTVGVSAMSYVVALISFQR